jgi:hypothetical protein
VIRLNYVLDIWKIQPPEAQDDPSKVATFVADIEAIFQEERWQWMKRAIQAHNAIEQTLVKNVADHTSVKFIDRGQSPLIDEMMRTANEISATGGKITETQTVTETLVVDKAAEPDGKASIEVSVETKREVVAETQIEPVVTAEAASQIYIAATGVKATNGKDHLSELPKLDNGDNGASDPEASTKSTSISGTN